jgi:DNA-binding transcriptional ArsR family regulator
MNDLDEIYTAESIEQMRAMADDLRQRIFELLVEQPMTVTQVGERLGIAPAKIHYHVRELERLGLLRLVETREKGGILEKYYRSVARHFMVPMSLTRHADPTAIFDAANEFLQDVVRRFLSAFGKAARQGSGERTFSLTRDHIWITQEELEDVLKAQQEAVERFRQPRGIEGEQEMTLAYLLHPTALEESDEEPADPGPSGRRIAVAGMLMYDRRELEAVVATGQQLDITVYGLCSFAGDVAPDLADRAIRSFRLRGRLDASDEVREVLQSKSPRAQKEER